MANIKPANHGKEWSAYDDDYIKNNYKSLSTLEIAKHLKRTEKAIVGERQLLKLSIRPPSVTELPLRLLRERVEIAYDRIRNRMNVLVMLCTHEKNNYKKDNYKKELFKLDNLKRHY